MELSSSEIKILSDFLKDEFTNILRTKGKSLVRNIIKLNTSADSYEATITGSVGDIYEVEISTNKIYDFVQATCTCPFYENNEENCKHISAVVIALIESKIKAPKKIETVESLLKTFGLQVASQLKVAKKIPLEIVSFELSLNILPDYYSIRSLTSKASNAQNILYSANAYPVTVSNNKKRFDMGDKHSTIKTYVEKADKKNTLNVGCNCNTIKINQPCYHIWGLLLIIQRKEDALYFKQFEDHTKEKNQLLANYGFNMDDEIAKDFKFKFYNDGDISIASMPQGLLPVFSENSKDWENLISKLPVKKIKYTNENLTPNFTDTTNKAAEPFEAAILFNLNYRLFNGFRIDGFKITRKGEKASYTSQKLKTKADINIFSNAPVAMQNALMQITEDSLVNLLKAESSSYYYSSSQPFNLLDAKEKFLIIDRYEKILQELAPYLSQWQHLYFLDDDNSFSKKNVQIAKFINQPIEQKIILKQDAKTISIEIVLFSASQNQYITNYTQFGTLIKQNETFYLLANKIGDIKKYIPHNKLIAPIANKKDFISKIVLPLSTKFDIDFGDIIKIEDLNSHPQPRIYLSELNEKFLMLTPRWLYQEYEIDNDNEKITTIQTTDGLVNIERNPTEESVLIDKIRNLHPSFLHQNNEYFYLHFDEVMKKGWFFAMYQQLQELGVPIFGMNNLKRFKYNTNAAKMEFKTGSGTDWFDIKMKVSYGEQLVPLATLRKAIINKQQFILLNDGTLGMLPEEWIKKFSTIMRMGAIKDDELQVSKLHWTIIDQLHEQQDGEADFEEILAKKQKLKDIENVKALKLPTNIKATLRDYQKSGFQWMNMLDEMGWGGCLADDMGLGKTLQTLTFLSGIQKKYKNETHLIVCPTSLIYNWESEINKFTPHLTYHINYGNERELSDKDINKADIIITSYGILRSDIEKFTKYKFGYVILDESQAIKNHLSQTAKAVGLLKNRNRLILSGTPVQNNTFDLYAQFNFINPGLLGNMEFFKTEFSNAIDKDNDKEKTEELRKLIYPFMLRRTKEQVAKDLPAKTETILWCEMEAKQRTIYNSFKDDYRKAILEKIEKEGFAKAGIFILAGLTKLRQICDSPAILNEAETYPNASIKIDELMREIEENASNHKALVFSQFTSMLHLLEDELKKRNIKYYYLDGSTKAADRKIAVENLKKNEEVKIFLISLKAGGVGLNLTAADYVYMVDPWWNPAAEQQAIDRTHRIGQTKSVFAYKLICKDSIEEKILQLQQRKKALSADLISDENGFVKKLTKEDVAYLFS